MHKGVRIRFVLSRICQFFYLPSEVELAVVGDAAAAFISVDAIMRCYVDSYSARLRSKEQRERATEKGRGDRGEENDRKRAPNIQASNALCYLGLGSIHQWQRSVADAALSTLRVRTT